MLDCGLDLTCLDDEEPRPRDDWATLVSKEFHYRSLAGGRLCENEQCLRPGNHKGLCVTLRFLAGKDP